MIRIIAGALLLALLPQLRGQAASETDGVYRIGPGVTSPRVIHKVEPKYSADARDGHIQGTVILQVTITEKGRPTDIMVLSPLGFGLDERAIEAIEKWQFSPGIKDGKPVKILATIEVNFRFDKLSFDEKAEHQRTSINLALQELRRSDLNDKAMERNVKTIEDLARQHYPPAMFVVGAWESTGEHLTKDPADGLALIQKAAEKNYGPALFEIAIRQIEGRDLPKDTEKGLDRMRQASVVGSPAAQAYLGDHYASGSGVPQDLDRARRYYRLCAAQGISVCQFRLAKLLLNAAGRPERDYVQAVAWLELAADQGNTEAKAIVAKEAANLTPTQERWMSTLKTQLVHK